LRSIARPELRLRHLWFGAGLFAALAIATLMLVPLPETPDPRLSDKTIHMMAFGALGFWFASIVARRNLIWLLLVLVAFGGLIEIAQSLMNLGRHAEWFDLLADFAGAVLGVGLAATPLGRWPLWMEALVRRTAA
jgi:VanZ family protein